MQGYERGVQMVQEETMITCPKCHGKGTYLVPYCVDESTFEIAWEEQDCEICQGLGKVKLKFYEELQKRMRDKCKN